jgi:UDP-glucuronate decarboxylase
MPDILREDLELIANCPLPWQDMKNSTVLITGATGLIGSLLVKALYTADQKHRLNLNILAAVRNKRVAETLFRGFDIRLIEQDIRELFIIDGKLDYIIHCAAVTGSRDMAAFPVECIQTAVYGTENILMLANEKRAKSVVYLSSMEVYGSTDPALEKVTEDKLGFLDLTSPRSCYPESKRICECLCNCYFSEYKVPVKIARLAQTFGAGVSKEDGRVFAQFAKSVIEGRDIVLHTDGSSTGNYCYTADAIKGILLLLLKGENGQAYNISNEQAHMTIYQMAQLVAQRVAGGKISVVFDIPKDSSTYGYAPKVKMKLCSDKIRALGWTPSFGLEEMYKRMIEAMEHDQ